MHASSAGGSGCGTGDSCDRRASEWVDRAVDRDVIRFAAGLEQDADRAAAAVASVRAALEKELGTLSTATPPTLVWLTTASATITTGVAMTVSTEREATVYLYSPSCDSDPRPRQFEKTVAQELSGDYLSAATARTPGWRFYDAPPWFVQGSEEWVTTLVHDRPADMLVAASDRATRPSSGAISADAKGVVVADPYSDGQALVAWLVLSDGPDVLLRILASDASTFDDALVEVTGHRPAELVPRYLAWRSGREVVRDVSSGDQRR